MIVAMLTRFSRLSNLCKVIHVLTFLHFKYQDLMLYHFLRRRSKAPTLLAEVFSTCGIPAIVKSDNALEFKSQRWLKSMRVHHVALEYTEPHHPNQNLAERRGGALKATVTHLLHVTQAPITLWCYALDYLIFVWCRIARRSLDWRTPYERHWGHTPDISVCRYTFWQPIWYYVPHCSFPESKMLKGRFLGFAPNVGDAFCFLIMTVPDDKDEIPRVLARSVIKSRPIPESELGGRVCMNSLP
jgi:hypothetical protein